MSYEGREEYLCEGGHRFSVNSGNGRFTRTITCPYCKKPWVFLNDINDTNCESYGEIPKEEWQKFLLTPEVKKTCDLGHEHVIQEATYRKPTDDEAENIRTYFQTQNDGSRIRLYVKERKE